NSPWENIMFRSDLLQSKRILITGGGTGLGKGMARRFLELGATVYICGRRKEVLAATEVELRSATTGTIQSLSCDVRSPELVEEMTRSLAVEGGNRGIRRHAIAPGPIPTEGAFCRLLPRADLETMAKERNPLRRFGTVDELANLAAFLVSDGSGYVNGAVIAM